ncbi:unnamed protein product [Prorocentrum cordatum]|uniref:Polypeptide N-acetylgalactosaminyltransferase n=1 Tax=Prorocentrum cordatum TaxID=2364126 RepID=A0ABN9VPV5_9DINO|nr:unnamed protein product [Polarella glacialis]
MVKTVESFCARTPRAVLEEIVVVDDGSWPPLAEIMTPAIPENCRVRIVRHEKPMGLMIAKQTGGDTAKGQFIGFYDCHVAPRIDWEKETIKLLTERPQRLVIPMIGDLNVTTWDEKLGGQLLSKCYMGWNVEFWWYEDGSDFVPAISGGLVATTREWWQASGGFDSDMRGWGGENLDQSLRAWLCGADIVRAKSSVISHMWRINTDSRTVAKFKLPHFHVDNVGRVAAAWFDEFKPKYKNGLLRREHMDVSGIEKVKSRLHCKPFATFLHRFRGVYFDGGLLPDRVFRIRSKSSGLCLKRMMKSYVMKECDQGTWFHLANQSPLSSGQIPQALHPCRRSRSRRSAGAPQRGAR